MEERVLEQWVLLFVLHVKRGKSVSGRMVESEYQSPLQPPQAHPGYGNAATVDYVFTQALHLAIETMPFRCAGFQFLFTADILRLLIRSYQKLCYNMFSSLPLHILFAWNFMSQDVKRCYVPTEYVYLGKYACVCRHCGTMFWKLERNAKLSCVQEPQYTKCCHGGRLTLRTRIAGRVTDSHASTKVPWNAKTGLSKRCRTGSETNCLVTSFWVALNFLLLFANPTAELPTPSFDYHMAFTSIALEILT
nr:lipid phosphate phosphatase delta-like [Tanacetum cinerariifolium]